MMIIGSDYHPGFQQIAFVDTGSGELQERRLQHREEAEKFYRDLAAQAVRVRVVAATMRRTMRTTPEPTVSEVEGVTCVPVWDCGTHVPMPRNPETAVSQQEAVHD